MTAEDDFIGANAAAELARLEALEDVAWSHQNLSRAPVLVKIGVGLVFIVAFTGVGLLAREAMSVDGLALGPTLAVSAISLTFVFVVTRLERHYAPIKARSMLPPKRVTRGYNKLYAVLLLPVYPYVPILLFLAASGRSWPWFTALAGGFLVITLVWIFSLKSLGILDRLSPPESAI